MSRHALLHPMARAASSLRVLTMLLALAACMVLAIAPAFHDGTHARAAIERLHDPIVWATLALLALRGAVWLARSRRQALPGRWLSLIHPAANFAVLAWLSWAGTALQHPSLAGACWLSVALQAMVPPRPPRPPRAARR